MSEFDGLAAVVTGGASGIGLAVAQTLTQRGARVAVLDLKPDVDEQCRSPQSPAGPHRAQQVVDQPAAPVARFSGFRCDVTDDDEVIGAVNAAAERFGGIDIVINNAGIGAQGDVTANSDDEWHRVLDVNLVGMVRVTRAALPYLRSSESAAIVNTCSIAAWAGLPARALYSASKGAVLSLTLAMATDHLAEAIRVNCVCPGTVDTPWVGRLLDSAADPEAERAALRARQPIGRLVTAEEVANAVAYLASPLSGSTTGTALAVDGGMYGLRPRGPVEP